MFSKAPRFEPEKPSEIPDPGYYNPITDVEPEYKRGGMLEKANRFAVDKAEHQPITQNSKEPAPKTKSAPLPPGISHLKQQIDQLQAQNTRLEKDKHQESKKFEEKINRLESTVKSLVRDNVSLQSDVSSQQKEIRLSSEREKALRAALEKAESGQKTKEEKASKLNDLQKKLDELERVHQESKKLYNAEIQSFKSQLEQSKASVVEHNRREADLRTEKEGYQCRVLDLQKAKLECDEAITTLKAQIREANDKTNVLERHRDEAGRLENTLGSVQRAVSERDLRIRKLEDQLAQQEDAHRVQVVELQDRIAKIEQLAKEHKDEAESAHSAAQIGEDSLTSQLNHSRTVLCQVAEQYGQLASTSVPRQQYNDVRATNTSLQLRIVRLERKIADREAQSLALAGFVREVTNQKTILQQSILELETDLERITSNRCSCMAYDRDDSTLLTDLLHMRLDLKESDLLASRACFKQVAWQESLSRMRLDLLLGHNYSSLVNLATAEHEQGLAVRALTTLEGEKGQMMTQLADASEARRLVEEQLGTCVMERDDARATLANLDARIKATEKRSEVEREKLQTALEKNKEVVKGLQSKVQQARVCEEALCADIEGLSEALSDAGRYEEAYNALSREVEALMMRNALAEDEAARISQFNAEILGHTNTNQKIHYVDRIRQDLAEAKQRLLMSVQERDMVLDNNETLRVELDAYRSVGPGADAKLRTRVARLPLTSKSVNQLADLPVWLEEQAVPRRDDGELTLDDLR